MDSPTIFPATVTIRSMSQTLLPALPIVEALPALQAALAQHPAVVLEAPPGAGKSTVVPLALLDAPWRGDRRILMLEPRRLATRAVAVRMAGTLGEPVGGTVGYRMRFDRQVSARTRVEVITEGLLTRLLQEDPALEDVAAILFDEFHERSLNADLGLALALEAQRTLATHVKLVVMSATLDGEAVAKLLGTTAAPAPRVTSAGRSFPVQIHYAQRAPEDPLREVTAKVLEVLSRPSGDILVFLPGAPEIRRVMRALQERALPAGVDLRPLYGDLPAAEQDLAVRAAVEGRRKVVLATSIAETSLTIDGVTVVVDSGLARSARFDPVTGMSRLTTTRVSRAAADQRTGRAGRTRAGECHRLWTAEAQRTLAAAALPELLEADLAPLALELACWGVRDASSLSLLDSPPAAGLAQARDVLRRLGAIDSGLRVTPHGRAMAALGVHPRLAHMMLKGRNLGHGALAADLAALLAERDVIGRGGPRDADLRTRLQLLERSGGETSVTAAANALRSARQLARQFRRLLRVDEHERTDRFHEAAGLLVALAYPDRVAQRRGHEDEGTQVGGRPSRFLLSQGRGAQLPAGEPLGRTSFLAVAQLDGGRTANEAEPDITLAAPLDESVFTAITGGLADGVQEGLRVAWDVREEAVVARRERTYGALVLQSRDVRDADPERVRAAMLDGLRSLGMQALPWSKSAEALRERMEFVGALLRAGPIHLRGGSLEAERWPDVSFDALLATLENWLAPWLDGVTRRSHLARLDLHAALSALLDGPQQRALEELAPTHFGVPSGSRIPIDYTDPEAPALQVRLQEVFGLMATPRLGGGRVPLVLHLLSPAQRPVQVTRDLESFWSRGYAEVKRELKGRYPKHYWPDDPRTAVATHRARPRP